MMVLFGCCAVRPAGKDIIIADFEGKDYGAWKATGEAFGPGPAQGTLPRQMPVTGYAGKGLVDSFYHGDRTTGTLTSPEFTINRKYMAFLIGGGYHPGKACINLFVDGKIVRTATGPNKKPGGTERLDPEAWDVSDLAGKAATIEIVDQVSGGWGHINIDHVVLTNRKPPRWLKEPKMDIVIEKRYLCFPVKNDAPKRKMSLIVDGQPVREFDIELADAQPDLWASLDMRDFKGKKATLMVDKVPEDSQGLKAIGQGDSPRLPEDIYHEKYRPQFHFSPRIGWTNDPNGLLYYKGEYHLFFQHNPYGTKWGNMHWGHAVSRDLVHWEERPVAVYPDELGVCFSGSGVVDHKNTSGFQTSDEKPLVLIYTSMGKQGGAQSLCYSADGGKSWRKYDKNPVLDNLTPANRDPKVIWHELSRKWIMSLYLDNKKEKEALKTYALFGSPDLKQWTKLCDVERPNAGECPDLFELPVDGNPNNTKWVFWGGNGNHWLGTFDGHVFKREGEFQRFEYGANYYASQTFSDIPDSDGRRIQIGWMNGGKYPGMPFNQQMSFPRVLTLRTTPEGIRLFCEPVKEIEKLHEKEHAWSDFSALKPGENLLSGISGELFDIRAEIELGGAKEVGFDLRGNRLQYSVAEKKLSFLKKSAQLEPTADRIKLQVLLDRTSAEIFGNDGRISMSFCFLPDQANRRLGIYAQGGEARIASLKIYELQSVWK
jgi:fructan beta-fructosidase